MKQRIQSKSCFLCYSDNFISGSTGRNETIETAKYSVLNAGFRYKSANDAPFIDE